MGKKSLVSNAASEKQVKKASERENKILNNESNDLRSILSTLEGRRVLWRILSECKTFGTIWHPSAAIHYNSGKQDLGHWLMGEITEAGEDYLFNMMKENYKKGEVSV